MALEDYLERLRLFSDVEGTFTDTQLLEFLTEATNDAGVTSLTFAASEVWRAKAGRYASLVDISEAGSSRKLGDLYKHALEMSKAYRASFDEETALTAGRPRTRAIVRPA
jgi:hypothetical protein